MRSFSQLSLLTLFVILFPFTLISQDDDQLVHNTYRHEQVVFGDLTPKVTLPQDLKETSGLVFWRNSLWTHNDSGGDPVIFRVDTATGNILQKITLKGATNRDWEDITHDDQYIYVGDFGNNSGNRKDLKIYKLNKDDVPESGDASVDAGKIRFSFSDQLSFDNDNREHDYDCESMISYNDNLYLFSKNWIDGKTRLYRLPKDPGDHVAELLDSLDVDGLVTAADINPRGDRIALLGYRNFYPFIVLIKDFAGEGLLQGEVHKLDFPFEGGVQTEGIAFTDSTRLMISCEELKTEPQVFSYDTWKWEQMKGDNLEPSLLDNWDLTLVKKKRKGIRFIAVDLTAMRGSVFSAGIETLSGKALTFPGYTFDRHMGKNYLELDVFPFNVSHYKVFIGNGSARSEKEIFVD